MSWTTRVVDVRHMAQLCYPTSVFSCWGRKADMWWVVQKKLKVVAAKASHLTCDLGEPTHTLVPCWMPKPLPPRNQCKGWLAPAPHKLQNVIKTKPIFYPNAINTLLMFYSKVKICFFIAHAYCYIQFLLLLRSKFSMAAWVVITQAMCPTLEGMKGGPSKGEVPWICMMYGHTSQGIYNARWRAWCLMVECYCECWGW